MQRGSRVSSLWQYCSVRGSEAFTCKTPSLGRVLCPEPITTQLTTRPPIGSNACAFAHGFAVQTQRAFEVFQKCIDRAQGPSDTVMPCRSEKRRCSGLADGGW